MDAQVNNHLAAYTGQRVLVTGAAGFLGANLIDLLKDVDCRIIRLMKTEAALTSLQSRAEIKDVIGDIREAGIWRRVLGGVDVVFHFAAQTSVLVADENPEADFEVNVSPMLRLLETCRLNGWRPIIIFSGTVTEGGIPTRLPVDDTPPDKPIAIYDLHKLIAENYLGYYADQKFVAGATLRLANVYGPGPRSSSADRGVLNLMIRKALRGEELSVYGKGDNLRDYVYAPDVARAFLMAAAHIERVNGQHFVIGSGVGHTLLEAFNLVADRVAAQTGRRVPVRLVEPPRPLSPIETRNFVADSSRFTQATGWRASYQLSAGIDRTIEAYQQQETAVSETAG